MIERFESSPSRDEREDDAHPVIGAIVKLHWLLYSRAVHLVDTVGVPVLQESCGSSRSAPHDPS